MTTPLTGKRSLLHANQDFEVDTAGKILSMRAKWDIAELAEPLRTCIVTGGERRYICGM